MRAAALLLASLTAALVLAGCGGRTPAEEAFLADLQERSSFVELPHPDDDLEKGHATCEFLAGIKPEERASARYFAQQPRSFGYAVVDAALTHLCPEMRA